MGNETGRRKRIYCILFYILALYFLSFCYMGLDLYDEGELPDGVHRLLGGETPYKDFYGYPPGRYLVGAGLFKLFGEEIIVYRIFQALVTAAALVVLLAAAERVVSFPAALAAIFLVTVAPGPYFKRYILLGLAVNALFHLRWAERPNGMRSFLVGLVAALTLNFRPDIAGYALFLFFIAVFLRRDIVSSKSYTRCALGFLVGALPLIVSHAMHPGMLRGWAYLLDQIFLGYRKMATPFPGMGDIIEATSNIERIDLILIYFPLAVYLTTILVFFLEKGEPAEISDPADKTSRRRAVLVILGFGLLSMNQSYWRTGLGHTTCVLPPAAILSAYLLDKSFRMTSASTRFHIKKYVFIIITSAVIILPAAHFIRNHGFDTGSPGECLQPHVKMQLPGVKGIEAHPAIARIVRDLVWNIETYSLPGESIFVIPVSPFLYFLADRKNPSYFRWILPGTVESLRKTPGNVQAEICADLTDSNASLIVIEDYPLDGDERKRWRYYAPELAQFILSRFRRVSAVGRFHIYLREDLLALDTPLPLNGMEPHSLEGSCRWIEKLVALNEPDSENLYRPVLVQAPGSWISFRFYISENLQLTFSITGGKPEPSEAGAEKVVCGRAKVVVRSGNRYIERFSRDASPGDRSELIHVPLDDFEGQFVEIALINGECGEQGPITMEWIYPVIESKDAEGEK